MGENGKELEHISLYLPSEQIKRIKFIQKTHVESTGYTLSQSSVIRTLLNEAFNARDKLQATSQSSRAVKSS